MDEIKIDTLIIKIDETSINRQIKSIYSWFLKGTSKEVLNSLFSSSLSILSSICTNGNWMSFMINNLKKLDGNVCNRFLIFAILKPITPTSFQFFKFSTINWQKIMKYLYNLYKWFKITKTFGIKRLPLF